jgi:predicted molibdopterin-dependent oxidoreductase YjgC|tara:strand:- start:105 stop:410 length:306 start_codon:yes stop_codon:yes gene_type:complete
MGIDSLKDLFMIGYSVLGISLLSDKVVNVANLQGTSFIKPLIGGALAYFMTPRRQRNIITILTLLATFGFSMGSLGRLGGGGNPARGQANVNTANVLGRLP